MYSPQDRLYTTPEVSVPAAKLMLQQVRLERILRRIGYVSNCNSTKCAFPAAQVPIKLPSIPPAQTIRPFNEFPIETSKLLHPLRFENSNLRSKEHRNVGLVNEKSDFEEKFKTFARKSDKIQCKFEPKRHPKSDIFQPFYPQKSPIKLPAIQRDKSRNTGFTITDGIKDEELKRHIEQYRKDKLKEQPKTDTVKKRKRRKKTHLERYFHDWQETYDKNMKLIDDDNEMFDYNILQNQEKFHQVTDSVGGRNEEQMYRDRISENIKQSVRKKKAGNGQSFELAPVYDMIFEKRSNFEKDIYIDRMGRKKPFK